MTVLDPEQLKKRFHTADAERDVVMAELKPIHAEHKKLIIQLQELEAKTAELAKQMQPFRNKLFVLENERARIARFLRDGDGISRLGKRSDYLS